MTYMAAYSDVFPTTGKMFALQKGMELMKENPAQKESRTVVAVLLLCAVLCRTSAVL